jgi:hypothetical protein
LQAIWLLGYRNIPIAIENFDSEELPMCTGASLCGSPGPALLNLILLV